MSKLTHAKHARPAARGGVLPASSRGARHVASNVSPGTSRRVSRPAPRHASRPVSHHESSALQGKRKRSKSVAPKLLIGIGCVLIVVVAAIAIGIFAYAGRLDSILAANDDNAANQALQDTLTRTGSTIAEQEGVFYMLILGSDWREGNLTSQNTSEQADNQRSDVIILARVDMLNRKVTLVSVPRDTPYRTADGRLIKINERYNEAGAAGMIEAVSSLTGAPISHYMTVSFSQLEEMVDLLGGVTVEVPLDLEYKDALTGEMVTIEAGKQVLTGQQAQIFARARHEFSEYQDMNRQNNVRTLLSAMLQQITEVPLSELPETTLELASCVGTDMRSDDLVSLVWDFATASQAAESEGAQARDVGSAGFTLYSCTGPYEGDINEETGLWLCYEDPEGWAQLMEVVARGEDPAVRASSL